MTQVNPLVDIVKAQKSGEPKGIYSVCSSNAFVIEACLLEELQSDDYVLIESTSNQVNQFGGYTGMNAADFRKYICDIANKVGFPEERILLGGDHLGPNVWQNEVSTTAMEKSCVLVADSIKAGYSKIHLDASMKCADDDPDRPLDTRISAERAAQMCQAAEIAFQSELTSKFQPCYIIGTEVPIPGGTLSGETEFEVTKTEHAQETIDITREAFYKLGLQDAWERVVGLVVQPGVEFGDSSLIVYDREQAKGLKKFIEGYRNLVFEAHSTDYQTPEHLKQMVEDHFAILKVGPGLTFAFREAVFALDLMEKEWLGGRKGVELSHFQDVLEDVMLTNPVYWKKYYQGDEQYLRFARKYSYSDRSRYYWPNADVTKALERLLENLGQHPVPVSLLSQYMPREYRKVMEGELENDPISLLYERIKSTVRDYRYACTINH